MRARYLIALAIVALGGCTQHVDDFSFVSIEALHDQNRAENLRLRFSTATNLSKAIEDDETDGIYARVSLCPYRLDPEVSIGRVEHNGVDLDTPEVRAEAASIGDSGPFVYEVPFIYNGKQSEEYSDHGGISQRDVAMPPDMQDWCVRMEGPSMMSVGLISNEFRIPKDAIARALATADMPPHYRW